MERRVDSDFRAVGIYEGRHLNANIVKDAKCFIQKQLISIKKY